MTLRRNSEAVTRSPLPYNRYRKRRAALAALGLFSCFVAVEAANLPKPTLGKYAVGVPTFRIKEEPDISSGKIFCAELKNGKKVLLTPLHLIGPAGGGIKQFTSAQCARQIHRVDVFPTSRTKNTKPIATGVKQLLTLGDMSRVGSKDLREDLLVFQVGEKCQLSPFKISSKLPNVNTTAYIVTSASNNKQALFEGSITESMNKCVAIKLKKPTLLPGASGAPVVDPDGVVIGMIYGTNDSITYYLNPGASIYLRLNTELREMP